MKKAAAVLCAVIMIFTCCVISSAFESQDKLTPAPELSAAAIGSTSCEISLTQYVSIAEDLRQTVYNIALRQYKTEEALLASPEKYLASPTALYLELSKDTGKWETVRKITDDSFVISAEEILDFTKGVGSTVFMRVLMASENYTEEGIKKIYVYTPSEPVMLCIGNDTVIPTGVPIKFSSPTTDKILLPVPDRKGYIFDGWSEEDGTRINAIPAGTSEITLVSHFIPRKYEVNYVFKTNISYSSGFIDNSRNPISYTVGTAEALYEVNAPIQGWYFDGWYLTPDFSGEEITGISEFDTGDKLFYAKWISDEEIERQKYEERLRYIEENHLGDPDGDGKTTAKDARYVLRCVVNLEQMDKATLKRVDYYNTNKITADNARITLRIAVGLESVYDIFLKNGILP